MLTFRDCPWLLVTVRSSHSCLVCESPILANQQAYRPLREGPGVMRYHRLCRPCGEALGTPVGTKETECSTPDC